MRPDAACSTGCSYDTLAALGSPMPPRSDAFGDLPGGDLVASGLRDLHAGLCTEEALLVLAAGPSLRDLGIDVPPATGVERPYEHRLYEAIEERMPQGAHSYYNALLRRIVSFAHAYYQCRIAPERRAEGDAAGTEEDARR